MLRANYKDMRDEFLGFEDTYKGVSIFHGLEKKERWKTLVLVFAGMENVAVTKHFPKTMAVMRKSPLLTIMFSEMERIYRPTTESLKEIFATTWGWRWELQKSS